MCKNAVFLTDLALLSVLAYCKPLLVMLLGSHRVTLSYNAVAVFCRFIYLSDAGMSEQGCSSTGTNSNTRLTMRLAI